MPEWGETIDLIHYERYMGLALKEAEKAFSAGEFPVGCIVAQGDRIIATGSRTGTTQALVRPSEIDHAEIRALKKLEMLDESFDPENAVLFCTMEPCLMCFAAIILSGIKTIVYAYEDAMGGGTNCNLDSMAPLYRQSNVKIVPGVLRRKSLYLFKKFFLNKGNLYWKNSFLEKYTLDAED